MQWLKSLFKKKEEKFFNNFEELENYFLTQIKQVIEKDKKIKAGLKEEFKQVIEELKKELKNLENAKLKNPNIEERIKDFMTGNRNNFLHQANYFINNIPDFNDCFKENYDELLKFFSEKTQKSTAVLMEFFAHEVRVINAKIVELTKIVEQLSKPSKELNKVIKILEKIETYKNNKKKIIELNKKSEEKKIHLLEKEVNNLRKNWQELENGEEHKAYLELIKELREKEEKLRNIEYEIFNLFSSISRVLKKYSKIALENQGLIHGYLKSTISTFLLDKANKIIVVLEKARSMELSEKDKNKLKKGMREICSDKLDKLRKDYYKIEKKVNILKEKIEKNTIKDKIRKVKEAFEKENTKLENFLAEIKKEKQKSIKLVLENKNLLDSLIKDIEDYCYVKIILKH